MSRDNIIGLVLIGAILLGYSIFMAPSKEEQLRKKEQRDSIAKVEMAARQIEQDQQKAKEQALAEQKKEEVLLLSDSTANDSLKSEYLQGLYGPFGVAATGEQKFIVLENDLMKLSLNTKGGSIYKVELKNLFRYDGTPLVLLDGPENKFGFNFYVGNKSISTPELFFKPFFDGKQSIDSSYTVSGSDSITIAFRLYPQQINETRESYIEFVYTLKGDEYMLGYQVNFKGMKDIIPANTTALELDWQASLLRQEKNLKNERNQTTSYFKYVADEVDYLTETKDVEKKIPSSLNWVSFKQQFFTCVLIAEKNFDKGTVSSVFETKNDSILKQMGAKMELAYDPTSDYTIPMSFYFGPNKYRTLKQYDHDLERQIPLGWSFFLMQWINRFAVIPVFNFLETMNLNYGIIILILTVLLKLILLPVAYKTYLSSARMRVLKPEIEEINQKYPKQEDAMKKQQATMALYKKAGVSPMSGCVPMLLQMPILFAFFRFFPASFELRQQGFLWATDLSSYDSILDLSFNIPFYGDHVSLFTLLMTISTIIYTKINNDMMGSSNQMPGMKTMMYIMPIMFLGMFNSFASGLSYYYFLANVFTFLQMFLFRKFINEEKIHLKIQENKKKNVTVKKSKWQQRLEDLAKQQAATQKKK